MKNKVQIHRLEGLAAGILHVLGILLFVLLSVTSLVFTRFFQADHAQEKPFNQIDFFPLTLFGAVILAVLALWIGSWLIRNEEKAERNLRILLAAVLVWTLAAGLLWVGIARSVPVSDQNMIYTSAQRFL